MIKERKFLLLNHKCHRKLKILVENKKDICKNKLFQQLLIRPSMIFPYLEVSKEKSWKVKLAIAEKVYFYRYPFYFPQDFLTYDKVYDLRAKIFFLLSFSTTSLKKEFQIQEVFDQVGISRQKMTRLRKSIIIIFEDAQDLKFIEPRFTLLMKTNKTEEVDKLTSNLLVKAKSIRYTEIP